MKPSASPSIRPHTPGSQRPREVLFGAVLGAFLGLALLKFGNPIILDRLVPAPHDLTETLYQPWPVLWGYALFVVVFLLGFVGLQLKPPLGPRWLIVLPAAWWCWQFVAASRSIDPQLTRVTLKHFTVCLLSFYLGAFVWARIKNPFPCLLGLVMGFLYVLWSGFSQHYGGLEETRRYFYSRPDWQSFPPEYLKRIETNRIFGTLVYPNALAGAILLLLPLSIVTVWQACSRLRFPSRAVVTGLVAYAGLACMVWSGSKGGWLVLIIQASILVAHVPMARRVRYSILGGILLLGLTAFGLRYSGYFQRGATSVVARSDYWRAAWRTFLAHPFSGSGPGTFSVSYRKMKAPESEMALLVHNDYLEQASDSGIIGFLTYTALIVGVLAARYRHSIAQLAPATFVVWLGLVGWAMQGFTEFGLYIPALAWATFLFLGWLTGRPPDLIRIDNEAKGS